MHASPPRSAPHLWRSVADAVVQREYTLFNPTLQDELNTQLRLFPPISSRCLSSSYRALTPIGFAPAQTSSLFFPHPLRY